jgi:hypothetical protein
MQGVSLKPFRNAASMLAPASGVPARINPTTGTPVCCIPRSSRWITEPYRDGGSKGTGRACILPHCLSPFMGPLPTRTNDLACPHLAKADAGILGPSVGHRTRNSITRPHSILRTASTVRWRRSMTFSLDEAGRRSHAVSRTDERRARRHRSRAARGDGRRPAQAREGAIAQCLVDRDFTGKAVLHIRRSTAW